MVKSVKKLVDFTSKYHWLKLTVSQVVVITTISPLLLLLQNKSKNMLFNMYVSCVPMLQSDTLAL
jgi:hypothetical protein